MNTQGQKSLNSFTFDNTLRIQLGNISCAVVCNNEEVLHKLRRLYSGFLTNEAPDITIELDGSDHMDFVKMGKDSAIIGDLYQTGILRIPCSVITGHHDMSQPQVINLYEKNHNRLNLEMSRLNRLLSLVYYSACKMKYKNGPPAMLVHACGILRQEKVILFAGLSGAGKSTIARLCEHNNDEVVNDEMVLVGQSAINGNDISIQNVPIIGDIPPVRTISAPLSCIFMLKKSHRTLINNLGRTSAYLQLLKQVITPVYIGQENVKEALALMADLSKSITETVPVNELEFNLDQESLWQEIAEFENQCDKGERN